MTTWDATTPPEPDNITTVIDASGDTWTRHPDGWTFQPDATPRWTWHEMLTGFGPVTAPPNPARIAALEAVATTAAQTIDFLRDDLGYIEDPRFRALGDALTQLDQEQP